MKSLAPILFLFAAALPDALACCAIAPAGAQAINTDQTVLILWDPATKIQHFVRQASFWSDSRDLGFIVPSPSRPELDESGNQAFRRLRAITRPPPRSGGGGGIGCSASPQVDSGAIEVVERKRVAGFDAVVLKAADEGGATGEALRDWLAENGYPHSPALVDWARPYLEQRWYFTALKVVDEDLGVEPADRLNADALRISFRTDTPLFPYREPESAAAAKEFGIFSRSLRVYFISDRAYAGAYETGQAWATSEVKWSGDITEHRDELLGELRLPADTGPARWWLTEFVDNWRYVQAPGDIHFAVAKDQDPVRRAARVGWDPVVLGFCLYALVGLVRRGRRGR